MIPRRLCLSMLFCCIVWVFGIWAGLFFVAVAGLYNELVLKARRG